MWWGKCYTQAEKKREEDDKSIQREWEEVSIKKVKRQGNKNVNNCEVVVYGVLLIL